MKLKKDYVGQVRVVVGIGDQCSGVISTDYEDCEKRGNVCVHGFWRRHDEENLEQMLERDENLIVGAFRKMNPHSSGSVSSLEYRDYRK